MRAPFPCKTRTREIEQKKSRQHRQRMVSVEIPVTSYLVTSSLLRLMAPYLSTDRLPDRSEPTAL
jgi:hypothetical protein